MKSSNIPDDDVRTLADSAPQTEPIRFYATAWCGDCRRSKRVFEALGVGYTYVDIEQDDQAARLVRQINGGMRSVPTITFPDGTYLSEPTNAELEAKLRSFAGA